MYVLFRCTRLKYCFLNDSFIILSGGCCVLKSSVFVLRKRFIKNSPLRREKSFIYNILAFIWINVQYPFKSIWRFSPLEFSASGFHQVSFDARPTCYFLTRVICAHVFSQISGIPSFSLEQLFVTDGKSRST